MIRPVPQRDTTREWIAAPALVLRTSEAARSGGHLDIWTFGGNEIFWQKYTKVS